MDTNKKNINRQLSVAPMMDCTDRHDRYLVRLISKNVMLYSEMVATKSEIHGDRKRILGFREEEKPVALQVGGSDKSELAEVAKLAEQFGYDEININLGCPSKKVQKNKFGACLMQEPDLVAKCIEAMSKATKIPVTIKTRIVYNDVENFEFLKSFIQTTKDAGAKKFVIHARKALLKKLSPKENLNIPPLKYEFVYQLKEYFKDDEIIINGGIKSTKDIKDHLLKVDGAMIGRAIYHSPYFLADIERDIFNNENVPTRSDVMEKLIPYIQEETSKGVQLNHIMRHTVGLFHGQNGSRTWKQYLSKNICIRDTDLQKVKHNMDQVRNTNPVTLER